MDKVKHYLRVALKYHFWILCAVIALLTLGTWYSTSAHLKEDTKKNTSSISSSATTLDTIAGGVNHPNQVYHHALDKMIADYKDDLRKLWDQQYIEQGKRGLQWPVESETPDGKKIPGLTKEFVEQVEPLRPIELTVPYEAPLPGGKPPKEILKNDFKDMYRNFIKSQLERLADTIDAVWPTEEEKGGGAVRRFGTESEGTVKTASGNPVLVNWHVENQTFLQDTRFDWSKQKQIGGRPTTLQILYAQEDLWVLETLIKIIERTNSESDAPHNAAVKEIKYLKLGVDAVGLSGQITRLSVNPAGTLPGPGGVNPLPGGVNPAPGVPPAQPDPRVLGMLPGQGNVLTDPAEGRYVDSNYQELPPARLRAAFKSNDPNEAFLAVAKRMPVRMHLVVDQRKLNRLLAECGNSNLIVEIRQMRINREPFAGGGTGAVMQGPGPGPGAERAFGGLDHGRPGGVVAPRNPPRGVVNPGRNAEGSGEEERPHTDIDVELYGIVYIYNPVNDAMVAAVANSEIPIAPATPTAPVTPAPAPVTPAPVPPTPMPVTPAPVNPVTPAPVTPMPTVPAPAPVTPAPAPTTTP